MQRYRNTILLLFGLLVGLSSCRETAPVPVDSAAYATYPLSETDSLIFLDSARAARAILRDSTDGFFELVRVRDIALQLGEPNARIEDTVAYQRRYKASLAKSVLPFLGAEREQLAGYLQEIFPVVEARFPGLWPDRIELVKISGTHFGPSAFYTREEGIYIPTQQLEAGLSDLVWKRVLLHEIFHIISREHRNRQAEWYDIIGFVAPEYPIRLPDSLSRNRLSNPDGIPEDWLIRLDSMVALPLIFREDYVPANTDFTEALRETYLPLALREGAYYPLPQANDLTQTGAFQRQTGGNTDYIIHPDEILAENFLRLFPELTGLPVPRRKEGKRVVEELRNALLAIPAES